MAVDHQYKQLCIVGNYCINKSSSNDFYYFSIADNQQEEVNLAVFEEGFNKNGATTLADDAFELEEEYNNTSEVEASVAIGLSYNINLQDEVGEAGEILYMDVHLSPCQLFRRLGDIGTLDLSSLAALQMHPYFKNYYISISRDDNNSCIVLDFQSKNDEWRESDYVNRAYDVVIPLSGKKIIIPSNFTNDEEITISVKSREAVSIKNILSSFFYPITYFTENGFGFSFNLTPETLTEGLLSLYHPLLSVGVSLAASVGKSCCNFISSSARKGNNAKKSSWLLWVLYLMKQTSVVHGYGDRHRLPCTSSCKAQDPIWSANNGDFKTWGLWRICKSRKPEIQPSAINLCRGKFGNGSNLWLRMNIHTKINFINQ